MIDVLLHPLGACASHPHSAYVACRSYNFWSGIAGCTFLISMPLAALIYLRHHNCGKRRCWRLGHPHPAHGQPVCRRHFHDRDIYPERHRHGDSEGGHTTSSDGGNW